eukprot:Nk52_evm4s346 gene=Nk52_evmTU4s346
MLTKLRQEFVSQETRQENIDCRARLQEFFQKECGDFVHCATTKIDGNIMETVTFLKPGFDQTAWLEIMKTYPTPDDFTFSVDPEKGMREIEREVCGPEDEINKIKEVQMKRFPNARFIVGSPSIEDYPAEFWLRQ